MEIELAEREEELKVTIAAAKCPTDYMLVLLPSFIGGFIATVGFRGSTLSWTTQTTTIY